MIRGQIKVHLGKKKRCLIEHHQCHRTSNTPAKKFSKVSGLLMITVQKIACDDLLHFFFSVALEEIDEDSFMVYYHPLCTLRNKNEGLYCR